ncbi:MAG TPA: tetratricopeptide repeat protein [Terriglobia bacterium]
MRPWLCGLRALQVGCLNRGARGVRTDEMSDAALTPEIMAAGDSIPPQAPEARRTRRDAALMTALTAVAALPYLNALANGFVYDDNLQVISNPYLRSFHYLRPIFTSSAWSFVGGASGVTNYYRPLMTFGYLLCFQLFGPSAFAFHLMNLLVHVAVVLLLYRLSARLFQDWRVGLAAALIFALHPVHSESVDWVGAITDLELTLSYLAAFWFYLRIPRLAHARLGWQWLGTQGALIASLILALLSKEQALTLPLIATLYEHFYREDRSETSVFEKIARYAPAWLLLPAYLLIRGRFLGGFAPAPSGRPYVFLDQQLLSAGALLGQYAGKILWPVRLCMYYTFPASWMALLPAMLGGIATLMAGTLLFVLLWKKARLASFGLVWFLITLAPVLNIRWMPAAAFAERYLYLPSVGLCWLIAWAAVRLWDVAGLRGRAWRLVLASVAAALAILAVARIVTRNRDWKDETVLFRRTLEVSPDAYVIHTDLGKVYWDQGQHQLAAQEWQAAARLAPNSAVVLDNLGLVLTKEHRYDEALDDLKRALQQSPDDTMAHIGLGSTYEEMGLPADAQREFETAVRLSPLNSFARDKLGQLYLDGRRYGDAEGQFRTSLAVEPTASAWLGLGVARWRQGDPKEAERDFKTAQAADPKEGRIHFIMAMFYGSTGRKAEALSEYQAGLTLDPASPQAPAALSVIQAETSSANTTSATPEKH